MSASAFTSTQLQSLRDALEAKDGMLVQHAGTGETLAPRVLAIAAAHATSEAATVKDLRRSLERIAANDTTILELEAQLKVEMSSSTWMHESAIADPIR